jgi:hypothetical protein
LDSPHPPDPATRTPPEPTSLDGIPLEALDPPDAPGDVWAAESALAFAVAGATGGGVPAAVALRAAVGGYVRALKADGGGDTTARCPSTSCSPSSASCRRRACPASGPRTTRGSRRGPSRGAPRRTSPPPDGTAGDPTPARAPGQTGSPGRPERITARRASVVAADLKLTHYPIKLTHCPQSAQSAAESRPAGLTGDTPPGQATA